MFPVDKPLSAPINAGMEVSSKIDVGPFEAFAGLRPFAKAPQGEGASLSLQRHSIPPHPEVLFELIQKASKGPTIIWSARNKSTLIPSLIKSRNGTPEKANRIRA